MTGVVVVLASWRMRFVLVVAGLVAAALLLLGGLGAQARGGSGSSVAPNSESRSPASSADGRFVAFESDASNLVPFDTNGATDVFVRDVVARTTKRVSVGSGGGQANGESSAEGISADGRFVAFDSWASNLVAGDSNRKGDVFVRDLVAGTTERVSVASGGGQANDWSFNAAISADGHVVAFDSVASNLVAGDSNDWADVFVRDRLTGTTERVSVSSKGTQGNRPSFNAAISADGHVVAFDSVASKLVAGDSNDRTDVFVRDRLTGTTERVSVSSDGAQGDRNSGGVARSDFSVGTAAVSANGRLVAFGSKASNLVAGDSNGQQDVFVRDRLAGTTERVSVRSSGAQAQTNGSSNPTISADGRFVAFESYASDLVAGAVGCCGALFARDRVAGTTVPISAGQRVPLRAGRLGLSPWPARAGSSLYASMPVNASGPRGVRISCPARLAGRRLAPVERDYVRGDFNTNGDPHVECVWHIPPNAHGKRLTGIMSVKTADGTAARRFRGRVH